MKPDPKNPFVIFGSVVVAGLLIAGTVVGWKDLLGGIKAFGARAQPAILAHSPRLVEGEFFSGEKVRFSVSNAQPEKVYWLFNEKEFKEGNVQFDYAFPFDSTMGRGVSRVLRVDAFYKDGDTYRTVTKRVRVSNLDFSSLAFFDSVAGALKATVNPLEDWRLERVGFANHASGQFAETTVLANLSQPHAASVASIPVVAPYSQFAWESQPEWISLEYTNASQQRLLMLQAVADLPSGPLQATAGPN